MPLRSRSHKNHIRKPSDDDHLESAPSSESISSRVRRPHVISRSRDTGPDFAGKKSGSNASADGLASSHRLLHYASLVGKRRGSKNWAASETSGTQSRAASKDHSENCEGQCDAAKDEDEMQPALKDVLRLVSISTEEGGDDRLSSCSKQLFESLIKIENSKM